MIPFVVAVKEYPHSSAHHGVTSWGQGTDINVSEDHAPEAVTTVYTPVG